MSTSHEARSWFQYLGGLGLFVTLALLSPGVQVAQATEAETAPRSAATKTPLDESQSAFALSGQLAEGESGSCRVDDTGRGLSHADQVAAALAELKAQPGNEDAVVFSGTGLNYPSGNDPVAEMRQIRQEVRQNETEAPKKP